MGNQPEQPGDDETFRFPVYVGDGGGNVLFLTFVGAIALPFLIGPVWGFYRFYQLARGKLSSRQVRRLAITFGASALILGTICWLQQLDEGLLFSLGLTLFLAVSAAGVMNGGWLWYMTNMLMLLEKSVRRIDEDS